MSYLTRTCNFLLFDFHSSCESKYYLSNNYEGKGTSVIIPSVNTDPSHIQKSIPVAYMGVELGLLTYVNSQN
jgi:hypothetical protein